MTLTADPFAPSRPIQPVAVPAPVDDDVEYLCDLPDAEFEQFVLAHLGSEEPPRIWRALCHPDVVDATANVLRVKLAAVQEHAAAKKVELAADPDGFAAWKAKARGFTSLLERRLRQVRLAVAAQEHADGRVAALEGLVRALAQGVNRHRLACIDADLAPEPHDVDLWRLLESLTLPAALGDGGGAEEPLSLAEAVCGGIWAEGRDGR